MELIKERVGCITMVVTPADPNGHVSDVSLAEIRAVPAAGPFPLPVTHQEQW